MRFSCLGCFLFKVIGVFRICEALSFISSQNVDRNLLVSTNKGYIQGRAGVTYSGKSYYAFEGIPYAAPPLGNLRFRAPQPISPWNGILDGSKERSSCVETMNTADFDIKVWGNEDCLYLNVYSPMNPKTSTKLLPVMVWIYGGAFMFGNSSSEFYGSDNFLDQDIIIVTFNYRVGLFGFLSTEDLESPGNYGLKDQHSAIQWTQKNIKNFGGDKNRITISGQSAGAASVLYQVAYLKNKGLFQGAIANSGTPLCNWGLKINARKVAFDLGVGVGITTSSSKELIRKLRETSLEKLKKASRLLFLLDVPQIDKEGFPFSPTIEPHHKGAFFTKTLYEIFQNGEFNKVSILMGINSLETLFFADVIFLLRSLNFLYDLSPGSLPSKEMNIRTLDERRQAGREILKHYFPTGSYIDANDQELLQYSSDDRFTRPLHKTVQLISKHTTLYYYLFSYNDEYGQRSLSGLNSGKRPVEGVAHLEEQFYMWKRRGIENPTGFAKLMSRRFLKIWSNFIRTRNPTPVREQLLQDYIWPPITSPDNLTYLEINRDFSLHQNYRDRHIKFWENLYHTYGHPPYRTY